MGLAVDTRAPHHTEREDRHLKDELQWDSKLYQEPKPPQGSCHVESEAPGTKRGREAGSRSCRAGKAMSEIQSDPEISGRGEGEGGVWALEGFNRNDMFRFVLSTTLPEAGRTYGLRKK